MDNREIKLSSEFEDEDVKKSKTNNFLKGLVDKMKEEQNKLNQELEVKQVTSLDEENLDKMVKWNKMSDEERGKNFIEKMNYKINTKKK